MIHLIFNFRLISKDNFKCVNRYSRQFLSDAYKQYEQRIAWEAKKQYTDKPFTGDLVVCIVIYYTNKKHNDLLNAPKSLCDAIQGIAYMNDRQIKQAKIDVIENSPKDWFEISIYKLYPANAYKAKI